ncbi:MAG TPA: hypothetical protein VGP70_26665 [Actinomadura sp.]|jgi:hypothetical protein|nr:hypothetical protein [Actinomadura sp.]
MTAVWTALLIETGAALVVCAALATWARRRFAPAPEVAAEPRD